MKMSFIYYCSLPLLLMIIVSCEKSEVQKELSLPDSTENEISPRTPECYPCWNQIPEDCCCDVRITDGFPATVSVCGLSINYNEDCSNMTTQPGCYTLSGKGRSFYLPNDNDIVYFCVNPTTPFSVFNTSSHTITVTVSCQWLNDHDMGSGYEVVLTRGLSRYFQSNGNCEIEACSY